MWAGSAAYQREESRHLSDRKRVQAVLGPFPVDLGLADGQGEFWQTEPGEARGSLRLQPGYCLAGSWISPIKALIPNRALVVTVSWQEEIGYLRPRVSYRAAARYQDVAQEAWQPVTSGTKLAGANYLQLRIEFAEPSRSWAGETEGEVDAYTAWAVASLLDEGASFAVDGRFPGEVQALKVNSELILTEKDILEIGKVSYGLTEEWQAPVGGMQTLRLAGVRPWLQPPGELWGGAELRLYLGLEVATGVVEWQEVYRGQVQQIKTEAGWGKKPGTVLKSQDLLLTLLRRKIGTPAADGRRQPFIRGYYRLTAVWQGTTPEQVAGLVKSGSGSAQLVVLAEDYYNLERDVAYRIEIETTGEIGEATFRWSRDGGRSWEKVAQRSTNIGSPYYLENNLWLYWWGGEGDELVAGDRWDFTGRARRQHYYLPGAPFQEVTWIRRHGERLDPEVVNPATGELSLLGAAAEVTARVVKDAITHPADIIKDILAAVGLEAALNEDDYRLCKIQKPADNLGVCFENLPALTAIKKVAGTCLYDFWVEAGQVRLQVSRGEEGC